jgi:serine/threonine-protein kinase
VTGPSVDVTGSYSMLVGMVSVGSMVAGYRIERVLGTGGMGSVFLAKNPTLPRRDALKVLDAELSRDRAFRERFIREADIVSQFKHPGIVSVYGRGETSDGELWIALQYVDGTDAEEALRTGTMTPHRAVHIVGEVAKALDYAHQRNVVHHDVKPSNLLLSNEIGDGERVFLSDFGVARPIEDADREMDGAFTATLAYSAPEVITGDPVDGRADIYSLGCTLFRLLTGRQPYFQADGLVGTIRAHLQQAQPRVSEHLPWATPDLDAVIAKALAKDPAQRFGSAREFAAAAAAAVCQAAPPAGAAAPYRAIPPTPAPWRVPPPQALVAEQARPIPPPRQQLFDHATEFRPTQAPRRSRPQVSVPKVSMPRRIVILWSVAAVLIVTAGVMISLVVRREMSAQPAAAPTSAPAPVGDPAVQEQLINLIPPGYPSGSCEPAPIEPGARAVAACGRNIDPGGPTSSTFTLAEDDTALQVAFTDVMSRSSVVVCPGNIQSPGAWRRNASPTSVAGTLYCGTRDGTAVIAWTTTADLLLNVVEDDVSEMADLYRWWSSHS